jgi:hypothetical protein
MVQKKLETRPILTAQEISAANVEAALLAIETFNPFA